MEADDPGGPDEGFKLPEPEDDDWDWVAVGFSTWADSVRAAERRMSLHYISGTLRNLLSPTGKIVPS